MLQKFTNTNKRIFMLQLFLLSTVVLSTDCCSSRVLIVTKDEPTRMQSRKNSEDDSLSSEGEIIATKDDSLYYHQRSLGNEDNIRLINLIMSTECSSVFNLYYCLNGGRCFNYTIANSSTPSCECSDGYFGERCESKYFTSTGIYLRQISMAKIYIVSFLAGIFGSLVLYGFCLAIIHC